MLPLVEQYDLGEPAPEPARPRARRQPRRRRGPSGRGHGHLLRASRRCASSTSCARGGDARRRACTRCPTAIDREVARLKLAVARRGIDALTRRAGRATGRWAQRRVASPPHERDGLRGERREDAREGVGRGGDRRRSAHYYERLAGGRDRDDPRVGHRAGRATLPDADALPEPATRELLDQAVVIKLNGGLGTCMGMDARQVAARGQGRADLPRPHRAPGPRPARRARRRGCRSCS